MADMNIKNVDETSKIKASFILKSRGKDLSSAVREMIDKLAKEYDKINKRG